MATILQEIISTIRGASIVPTTNVNFGYTDRLSPPTIHVVTYEDDTEYDTGGPVIREATFTVLCVDKSSNEAEALATLVDTLLNMSTTVTTTAMRCLREKYRVSQLDEKLYQFGAELNYRLIANI
jgi:hypothetical protein